MLRALFAMRAKTITSMRVQPSQRRTQGTLYSLKTRDAGFGALFRRNIEFAHSGHCKDETY